MSNEGMFKKLDKKCQHDLDMKEIKRGLIEDEYDKWANKICKEDEQEG